MSVNMTIPVPDFLDIDEATSGSAQAVVEGKGGLLNPGPNATKSVDKKSGDMYERWSERVVIEAMWRDVTKTGLLVAVIQMKVRAGEPNQHERTWTRLMISPEILAGRAPTKEGHKSMHDRSIGAIATLLKATGYYPKSGGISGKLLNGVFPATKGSKSLIGSPDAVANFCNSPNKGDGAKTDRQTRAESFLPAPGAVVPTVQASS